LATPSRKFPAAHETRNHDWTGRGCGRRLARGRSTGLTISPALAKTVTYRTIATIVDFITDYVVVGTVAEAMILSATGFVLGPFVYYGHEKAWEYFADESTANAAPAKEVELLPAAV
jgi:uncharacterized membrane protein